jgi:hypothetical protein
MHSVVPEDQVMHSNTWPQVDFLSDAQRRLQSELEAKEAKIGELQRARQELFDKMVQVRCGCGWRRGGGGQAVVAAQQTCHW